MRTEARTAVAAPAVVNFSRVPLSRYVVFAVILSGSLFWDLYSKWYVFETLGYENGTDGSWLVWLWGDNVFRLLTHFNHGALFGIGQGMSGLFALLSVVAVAGVLYWLFVKGGAHSWWLTVALSLLLSGALGNLYDRLGLHGLRNHFTGQLEYAVRDFLYFELIDWPIFNFADTYLVTGAIMLVIQSFRPDHVVQGATQPENQTSDAVGSPSPDAPATPLPVTPAA